MTIVDIINTSQMSYHITSKSITIVSVVVSILRFTFVGQIEYYIENLVISRNRFVVVYLLEIRPFLSSHVSTIIDDKSWLFPGLEQFSSDKSKCQEHFDVYKECKKKEVSFRCYTASFFWLPCEHFLSCNSLYLRNCWMFLFIPFEIGN